MRLMDVSGEGATDQRNRVPRVQRPCDLSAENPRSRRRACPLRSPNRFGGRSLQDVLCRCQVERSVITLFPPFLLRQMDGNELLVRAEHVPKCLSVSHRWMVHHEANSLIVTVSHPSVGFFLGLIDLNRDHKEIERLAE